MANDSDSKPHYILPRDVSEDERLNFQHRLLNRTFGGLHRAPLDKSKSHRVLDIGCGTGLWAVEYANQNPTAEVVGMDISSSPEWAEAPPNCTLHIANVEDTAVWSRFDQPFDYIHGRLIVVSIKSWPNLFEEIFSRLSSGGWFEIQDIQFPPACVDEQEAAKSKFVGWGDAWCAGMSNFGLAPYIMKEFPVMMPKAGFSPPIVDEFKMYTGPWADTAEERELGNLGNKNMHMGFRGFTTTIMKAQGWTDEQIDEQIREVLEEMDDGKLRTFLPLKVIYAQKPV